MKFLLPCLFLLLAACADGRDARPNADRIAASGGLTRMELSTRPFRLVGYVRFAAVPVLRVYIEGEGHAWASPDRPSDDPTPWAPVALALAARDPSASVAYLGRHCQYVALGSDPTCEAYFWTDGRYHESVIASMNAAIDRLRTASGAATLELVGFSGGGAVAALIAARRHDVANLRTVAANLDIADWTARQRLRPLRGSLNPADEAERLTALPQMHFSGREDAVVDTAVARAYRARFIRPDCIGVAVIDGVGHGNGWPELWPDLLRRGMPC